MKSFLIKIRSGVVDNLSTLLTVLAAFGAGLLFAFAINSQITDSVTAVRDQITDAVTVPNPNIERSNLINGAVPPKTVNRRFCQWLADSYFKNC